MVRREPDGDTDTEVTIAYVRRLEKRLADLEAYVAGKLPHDHDSRYDGRYVNEAGDTMTGVLDVSTGGVTQQRWGDTAGSHVQMWHNETDRAIFRHFDGNGQERFRIDADSSTAGDHRTDMTVRDVNGNRIVRFRLDEGNARVWFIDGDVLISNDLDVSGAKNAEIVDPDDATKAFRFACVEADEPGLLFHRRTVTIPTGGNEQTVDLPSHWSRIATAGDAMVTPLDSTRDQAPAAAAVDLTVPEVTVRGKPGDYRVWVAAARADKGVDGWTHEVEVSPDDEDV